ncbi:MAG: queuosine precursor transporter [Thermodesulfobacteriota bacterium]|nr:queuosine precursor transporter [bacterium]MEC7925420.1 queuosine precursor transporter [Thermodesulfobacteriota bacterium]|tara:strand:- start:23661 stop:24374 length:714 start_codon:yes stop_codon:yes gene_type:complete
MELNNTRRLATYIILAGIFISSMTMLNILGTSRFIDLSFNIFGFNFPLIVAIGVLPYPITFLCTDLISEIFGKKRATIIVWTGLVVNLWLGLILWLGGIAPEFTTSSESIDTNNAFLTIRHLALGTITASMVAYFLAQYIDVSVFHFLKNLTKGKYLWIRNNGSTMISQLVDTSAVILITHFLTYSIPLPKDKSELMGLMTLIFYAYLFKFFAALIDTPIFYMAVKFLKKYLSEKNE